MGLSGPVSNGERNLRGLDFFLLWSGAAISLAEIWAGGLLLPLGLAGGLVAIVLGHVIGNTPMALAGVIGSRHGVPAIVSTRGALGNRGAHLPAALNIVQLAGWTAVMLWIAGHSAARLTSTGARTWILLMGALTTLWALAGHRLWKWLQRCAVFFLLVLSVLMTRHALGEYGFRGLLAIPPKPGLTFMAGLDLVIAMPVSWIPLVSDYSRYAADPKRGFWCTWWGYLIVSSWMYVVGLCAALATGSGTPDAMVLDLMSSHGLLLSALMVVLFSTLTTNFLDIYSNAVSMQAIWPRLNERAGILLAGASGTLLALFFPAQQYENFLLLIGSAFCPLFGVVMADYFVLNKSSYEAYELFRKGRYWRTGGVNSSALLAWLCGFLLYRLSARGGWVIGASLPAMLAAGALYLALMKIPKPGTYAPAPEL